MKTADRAAVALIYDGQILLIERHKPNRSVYYVLPGGGVEPGETPAQAAVREAREELGVGVELLRLVPGAPLELDRRHWIYLARITSHTKPAWQETAKQKPDDRFYVVWQPLVHLASLNLKPGRTLAQALLATQTGANGA